MFTFVYDVTQQCDWTTHQHVVGGDEWRGAREGEHALVDPVVRRRRNLNRPLHLGSTRHQDDGRGSHEDHTVEVGYCLTLNIFLNISVNYMYVIV